jgi:hypothetical protein
VVHNGIIENHLSLSASYPRKASSSPATRTRRSSRTWWIARSPAAPPLSSTPYAWRCRR